MGRGALFLPRKVIRPRRSALIDLGRLPVIMKRLYHRRVLAIITIICIFVPGCLSDLLGEDAIPGEDSVSNLLSSEQVNAFFQEANLDIAQLASQEERFAVTMMTLDSVEGSPTQVEFIIAKDEVSRLAETGATISSGAMGLEYSIVRGDSTVMNVRVGNQWFTARDEVPMYVDPFVELLEQEEESTAEEETGTMLDDLNPDFDLLEGELVGFDWVTSMDEVSLQQVATSSNETHSVMVEFLEFPPRLQEVLIESNDGTERVKVVMDWGDDAILSVVDTYPRTSVDVGMNETYDMDWGSDTKEWAIEVTDDHDEEVFTSQIDIHLVSLGDDDEVSEVVSSMALTEVTSNQTDDDGYWYHFTWNDADSDGYISSGDSLTVSTNASIDRPDVMLYDNWAESYEGGALPGFGFLLTLVAIISVGYRKRQFN